MYQKVNGTTVPTKVLHVPSFDEVQQAELHGEPIKVMVATYDGNGTETVGFLELSEIKKLRQNADTHYSFSGSILHLDVNTTTHCEGVVIEMVGEIDRGYAHVVVDSAGGCIAFSMKISVSIQFL